MPALSGVEGGENAFAWSLDPIGNRISATKNEEPENYSANQLNLMRTQIGAMRD